MNLTVSHPHAVSAVSRGRQCGFTLIEMLIAITIGLGILAGLVGVLASTSGNSRTNDRTAELITNGRYALDSVKQELRQAGFLGRTWGEPGLPAPWVAPASGCFGSEAGASAGAFVSNVRQGIWGANDSNPFGGVGSCIANADYLAGNDVLVIRRLATIPTAAPVANTVYFRSSYERGQVFRGAVAPVFPGAASAAANYAVEIFVYYVRPYTVAVTEDPQIPALVRSRLGPNGLMTSELVASGIERFQVQYGRLATDLNTQYLNADAILNQSSGVAATSSDTVSTDWDDVNSVRIWLLSRNSTAEPGYVNTTPYALGDLPAFIPNDGFRRQLFSTVVQLRN